MAYVWYGTAIATACGLSMAIAPTLGPALMAGTESASATKALNLSKAELAPQAVDTQTVDTQTVDTQTIDAQKNVDAQENADLTLYQAAGELAEQAAIASAEVEKATDSATHNAGQSRTDSVERSRLIQQSRTLWQAALKKLDGIPDDSPLSERKLQKQSDYQKQLAAAVRQTTALQKTFIADTLQDVGVVDPNQVHITLCRLKESKPSPQVSSEHCQHHQGDQLLASAASLIKVPVAIALIEKSTADSIPLTTKLLVSTDNYTENSEGLSLEVGREYSLQEVMSQMIQASDNIGTNQLIDYLGYESINQALSDYEQTSVGHKLMGNEAMPANFGEGINQTTTNDITAMMTAVYHTAESQSLRTALARQQDKELGHAALQTAGPKVQWLGEKTAQNNLLVGTTLAMSIEETPYILTVALDNSSDIEALRDIISRLAIHLSQNGPLVSSVKP